MYPPAPATMDTCKRGVANDVAENGERGEHYVAFCRNGHSLMKHYEQPPFDEEEFRMKATPPVTPRG